MVHSIPKPLSLMLASAPQSIKQLAFGLYRMLKIARNEVEMNSQYIKLDL